MRSYMKMIARGIYAFYIVEEDGSQVFLTIASVDNPEQRCAEWFGMVGEDEG